jgi:hypothetical protein
VQICFCFEIDFVDVPNVVELGKPLDIKWNVSNDYKNYNFTINMLFYHASNGITFNITTIQSNELFYPNNTNTNTHFENTIHTSIIKRSKDDDSTLDENISTQNSTEAINTVDIYKTTIQIENKQCNFRNTPLDGWTLKADVHGMNTETKEKFNSNYSSEKIKRQLDCNDPCIENDCKPKVEEKNREVGSNINGKKAEEKDKSKLPLSYIIGFSSLLLISFLVFAVLIYEKKFKKKEDDPIPIFSVEDSSYCYDMNNHSPILGNVSYQSNILDKSLLGVNRGIDRNNRLTASPKMMDQAHLSVQLHPINNVSDYYSHSSQHSSKTKISDNSYNKNPQELHKPESNVNYNIPSNISSPESPNMTALSPISMASTIPFIPSPKPVKKMSSRYENNHIKHPYIYSESPIVIDKKPNNSFLFQESPRLSETKSRISDKHSFTSNHTENEDEAKVLSSKHYVLSDFEGDYDKEELVLHYGDIVSVINILPDGWAYGELLMKYNSYDINNNNANNMKKSQTKYRKFGYYPIRCLSHEEESDESNSPPKKMAEEENQNDLKKIDASSVPKPINNMDNQDKKDSHHTKTNSNSSAFKSNIETKDKLVNNKRKSFNKRTSFLKLFKRKSNDINIPNKDTLLCYNEPNNVNDKITISSRDVIINDDDSDTDTIYHDAEEAEKNNNIKYNSKRISARSSISYI